MHATAQLDSGQVKAAIARDLALLHQPGEVFELRALDAGGRPRNTASGYFNDLDAAADWALRLDIGKPVGVYHTINPLNPALLARAANRVKQWANVTATDSDVMCRRWLMLDIDPPRPSGICATEAEKAQARETAGALEDILRSRGWPYLCASSIADAMRFAERLGLTFEISSNSWWYPGQTTRLVFQEPLNEEGER